MRSDQLMNLLRAYDALLSIYTESDTKSEFQQRVVQLQQAVLKLVNDFEIER